MPFTSKGLTDANTEARGPCLDTGPPISVQGEAQSRRAVTADMKGKAF